MATARSRHAHGRSEIWERGSVQRAIGKERRRLGKLLRTLRAERGASLEEAAEQIGIHSKHLQRVELGKANVTLATLVAITLAYRVSLPILFREPEKPTRES